MTILTLPEILSDATQLWTAQNNRNPSALELREIWSDYVPRAIGNSVLELGNGLIDPTPVIEAAKQVLTCYRLEEMDELDDEFVYLLQTLGLIGGLIGLMIIAAAASTPLKAVDIFAASLNVQDAFNNGIIVVKQASGGTPAQPIYTVYPYQSNFMVPAGYSLVCQAGSVQDAAARAYDQAAARLAAKVGKWGGVVGGVLQDVLNVADDVLSPLGSDTMPDVGASGFRTLYRDDPPETAIYNLVAPTAPTGSIIAVPAPNAADGTVLAAAPSLEYRAFENRGLEGRLLIEFPTLGLGSGGGTGALAGLPSTTALPALLDLLINVRIRGSYDPSLKATLVASQAGATAQQQLVATIAGASYALEPGAPQPLGELQTVHFSLRAHRQRTLEAWLAEWQVNQAAIADPTQIKPLALGDGFVPLTAAVDTFMLTINPGQSAVTTLADLETTLEISLAHLGLPIDALTRASPLDPELVEMGVAVIPTQAACVSADGLTTLPTDASLDVHPLLAPLLSSTAVDSGPAGQRLFFRPANGPSDAQGNIIKWGAPPTVPLSSLVPAAGKPPVGVTLDLSKMLPGGVTTSTSFVYDVLFSLTFRTASLELTTS